MPKHTLIRRRCSDEDESDKYYHIDTVGSISAANKLALETSGEPGDILIVCDTAYVSDLRKHAKKIFVVNTKGVAVNTKVVPAELYNNKKSINWLEAWEGNDVYPIGMMRSLRSSVSFIGALNKIVLDLSRSALDFASDIGVKEITKSSADAIADYLSGNISNSRMIGAAERADKYVGIGDSDGVVLGVVSASAYAVVKNFSVDYEVAAAYAYDLLGNNEVSGIIRRHMPLAKLLLTLSSTHP